MIDDLTRQQQDAEALQYLSGYGGLPSAQDMKEKFEQLAVGDGGATERIGNLIEIANTMRDTYAAMIGKLGDTDEATSQALRGVEP